jgi:hypothetical protein
MLAVQVLSALRARGQATLDASAAYAAGSSPRLHYELEEAVDPVNEGPETAATWSWTPSIDSCIRCRLPEWLG